MTIIKMMLAALLAAATMGCAAQPQAPELKLFAAPVEKHPDGARLLAAARAGSRLVAVGDHGLVLLSDDQGRSYRQAQSVPAQVALTAVSFADERRGWAVGHWGVILHTADGGEHWTLQRSDSSVDQPLFSVYFRNAQEGWAVGLWSLMLHTEDGGATWTPQPLTLANGKRASRSLYAIFPGNRAEQLFVACEQGQLARSLDGGKTWHFIDTGYTGSFWAGTTLRDGSLLLAGLRGSLYRSADGGQSWQAASSPLKSSLTTVLQQADGSVLALGLDGAALRSRDGSLSFSGEQRSDRRTLTAAAQAADGALLMFSTTGPVPR